LVALILVASILVASILAVSISLLRNSWPAHASSRSNLSLIARWMCAKRSHHLGWAMWDYQDAFGAVTKKDAKTAVDNGVIEALGLKPQAAPGASLAPAK
jgi:hypothetical protein